MKTVNKFNGKNISLFSGLVGFVLIFILFAFHIFTVELLLPESSEVIDSFEYTSYSLFFAKSGKVYYSIISPIFFSFFIINFVLYLTLLILSKKVNRKLKFLGIIGVVLNTVCIILFFCFLFSIYNSVLDYQFSEYRYIQFDFSTLLAVLITFEFLGLFGNYVSWIYTCKKCKVKNVVKQINENSRMYWILVLFEFIAFIIPIIFLVACLPAIMKSGNFKNNSKTNNYEINKSKGTITINNKEYLLKNDKIIDIASNKEVGHLKKDEVILYE